MNTVWILGDQLSSANAALNATTRAESRVLMIESKKRGSVEKYHQVKLALVYSAMRHFADDLRRAHWQVDYYKLEQGMTFESAVRHHIQERRPASITLAEPNSFFETEAIAALRRKLGMPIVFVPTNQFLLSRAEFQAWASDYKRLLMENHYRRIRKQRGWLMETDTRPVGGVWNFDQENRAGFNDWKRAGRPAPKGEMKEPPDAVSREVVSMVQREFSGNPGDARRLWLPVDRASALRWLSRFISERLPSFGSYEDLMVSDRPFLFHSVLSPLLNLGLLTPSECVDAAIAAYENGHAPLNSVEGFVRQIVGWREFINGVYWYRGPEYKALNGLGAERPLPHWFYTGETEMNCLRIVLSQTIELGWNHHIQRLMVIGNYMLLTGVRPQEALTWFLEMYVDAFDWVMAANVIGMSLYADGGYMATKPYAAGSAYIQRMSNYCEGCRFDPKQKTGPDACPFNYLYWNFIGEHGSDFASNQRMRAIVASWLKRDFAGKEAVRRSVAEHLAD